MPQLLVGKGVIWAESIEVALIAAAATGVRDPQTLVKIGAAWYVYNTWIVPKFARDTGVPR